MEMIVSQNKLDIEHNTPKIHQYNRQDSKFQV
jgi:hypothetical protein